MVNTAPPESAEAAQRREALEALIARTDTPTVEVAPVVVPSGREVYCGGDERRLLVKRFSAIGYRLPTGVYMRTKAQPGDTVLLVTSEADRLDRLGVTVDPAEVKPKGKAPKSDAPPPAAPGGVWTDEQLGGAKAGELVAYVAQHPDERPRVRALEEARVKTAQKGSGPRATVLKATEPTPEEDADAQDRQAARQEPDEGGEDTPPPAAEGDTE